MLTLPGLKLEEEMRRRTEAIDAVADYCLFEEGDTCRLRRDKRPTARAAPVAIKKDSEGGTPSLTPSLLDAAILSVKNDKRPRLCFLCVGRTDLPEEKRAQTFWTHGDVTKHIR